VKRLLSEYRIIEDILDGAIRRRFGLAYEMPQEVHEADARMYMTESTQLMPASDARGHYGPAVQPYPIRIVPQPWHVAREEWLSMFRFLTNETA
jgi:hypothetical protein